MNEEKTYECVGENENILPECSKTVRTKLKSRWKMIVLIAALMCLAALLVTALPSDWEVHYNEVSLTAMYIEYNNPQEFLEELSDTELKAILPAKRAEWMEFSDASACFNKDGNLLGIGLKVTTTVPGEEVTVYISENGFMGHMFRSWVEDTYSFEDMKASKYRGVEYTVLQYIDSRYDFEPTVLSATATVNGRVISLRISTTTQEMEQLKKDYKEILECFTYYSWEKPNLKAIKPEGIPEYT